MKNNKIYLLGACLLCAVTVFAQNVSLQPPPQQLIVQNKTIDLPAVYQLNGGEEANPHAVKAVSYTHLDVYKRQHYSSRGK